MRYSTMLAAALVALAVGVQVPAQAADTKAPADTKTPAETKAPADSTAGAATATAPDPDKVVATVGDAKIQQWELDMAEDSLDPQLAKMPEAQRRVAALSTAIDVKMLARKAEEAGLDKSEEFKREMQFTRERTLHNLYFKSKVVDAISEADIKARYEKEVAAQPPQEEVKARHILLKTKQEAEDVIKQLDKGADFAKLAKEKSTGPSAAKGGELGYFTKGQMVPAFEEAAFALKPGQYTEEPVKTQFGWHVIQVEDKRKAPPPPLDQVSDQVKQVLMRERYLKVLKSARDQMKVDIADPQLKKAYDAVNAGAPAGGDSTTATDSAN